MAAWFGSFHLTVTATKIVNTSYTGAPESDPFRIVSVVQTDPVYGNGSASELLVP